VAMECKGIHPLQEQGLRPKPPLHWRVVCESVQIAKDVLIPNFLWWIPKDDVLKVDWRNLIIYLTNESKIDFFSSEQEAEKFGSTKLHGIYYDEEPREDIYNMSLPALIDYAGIILMAMTPVHGISWVYDRVWLASKQPSSEIFSIKASVWENPYIPDEQKRTILEDLQGDERKVAEYGDWVQFAGLVWPEFKNEYVGKGGHIIDPFPLPKEGTVYMAIDPMDRTQAVLWLKVLPSKRLIFFDELLTEDMLVEDVARLIKEKEKTMGFVDDSNRYIDWNASRVDPVSGQSVLAEYARDPFNICCSPAVKDWVLGKSIGKEYWNARDKDGKPLCVVFSTLKHFRRQLVHYVHADYKRTGEQHNLPNKPKKKDDHLPDCARYLFAVRPEYINQVESMQRVEIPHLHPLSGRMREPR